MSNNIIKNINKTRYTLKEILSKKIIFNEKFPDGEREWNTDNIPDLSDEEIEILFDIKTKQTDNKSLSDLGLGHGLFLKIPSNILPDISLHVIYYNFSSIGKNNSRVTKNLKDKIVKLYEESYFNEFDSVIIIVNEDISDTINKTIHELNNVNQNELKSIEFNDDMIKAMDDNQYHLEKRHFRNVWIFDINTLINNLSKNRLVPDHFPIREEKNIQEILKSCNCSKIQLPIIKNFDIMAKYCLAVNGDIIRIDRVSKQSGTYPFYRFVR